MKKLLAVLSALALVGSFTGCNESDPAYSDPGRSEVLAVSPQNVPDAIYSDTAVDPFQDGTYIIQDHPNFKLKVYNTAAESQNRLELAGNNPNVKEDINDIDSLNLVVTIADPSKLTRMFVAGTELRPESFQQGQVGLVDNAGLNSGARLPGYHAIVKNAGKLRAGGSLEVVVSVAGAYGLEAHFDAYGNVWGGRVLVTGPKSGTSYLISTPKIPPSYVLSVSKTGNGSGEVTSNIPGIDCGAACAATYQEGTNVTLTATPTPGSAFKGWSGACSGTSTTCNVAMYAAKAVTAKFELVPYTLAVVKTGTGEGTVTSSPAGIDCGATCSADLNFGTSVDLSASAAIGSEFTGWTDAVCSGSGGCSLTLNSATTVTANFELKSYVVTITKGGTGTGQVTSLPGGIDCGATCSAAYPYGTSLTLTATPDIGQTFAGWSGACAGSMGPTCIVAVDAAKNVVANFDLAIYTVEVTKSGTAGGTVTSSPAGIDCGAACMADFAFGTTVTFTAAPNYGAIFTGWSGACTGTDLTCTVLVASAHTVNANFNLATFNLGVAVTGVGGGEVVSTPAGIDCGLDCSEGYLYNSTVTLLASPNSLSLFAGWSGACTGTNPVCVVTMDAAKSVVANFDLKPIIPPPSEYLVSVSKDGTATGTITSSPSGIDCGASCSAMFPSNSTITLIATPGVGSVFAGWGGACTGTATTCEVTVDQAQYVTATFNTAYYTLTVVRTGNSVGTVTGASGAIDCGTQCTVVYPYGTSVTLNALPDPTTGFTVFTGWNGGCVGSDLTCTFTLTGNTTVGANFDTITQINISLNASKIYQGGIENWGTFVMPQRANLEIPAEIILSKGNTGNHVAAIDFEGTVCCYKGGNSPSGKAYIFQKCIDGTGFAGAQLNSLVLFDKCKSNTTPVLASLHAGSSIQLPRYATITLLVENDDNRNPPPGSPNYEAIVSVVIDVLRWFQP